MGGNNENDRVASPESVPIHFFKLFYFRFPATVISAASGQTVVSTKVSVPKKKNQDE